jgi:hypothetical protein
VEPKSKAAVALTVIVVHRYNEAKDNAKDVEFKPALWDYGIEVAQDNLRTDELWSEDF